jgi:hypothetical protein
MLASRSTMLNATRPAVRAARRAVAPLQVRAFKTDDPAAAQHKEAADQQPPADQQATAVARPSGAAPALRGAPSGGLAGPMRLSSLFDEMEHEMNQMTRAFFSDDLMWPFASRRAAAAPGRRAAAPPLQGLLASRDLELAKPLLFDLHEGATSYTIQADVPGM